MNEAYHIAIKQLRERFIADKYPATMTVDAATFETLRAGIHANRDATYLAVPLLEDQQIQMITGNPDARSAMHMVIVKKEEKPA